MYVIRLFLSDGDIFIGPMVEFVQDVAQIGIENRKWYITKLGELRLIGINFQTDFG